MTECHLVTSALAFLFFICHSSFFPAYCHCPSFLALSPPSSPLSSLSPSPVASRLSYLGGHESLLPLFILNGRSSFPLPSPLPSLSLFSYLHLSLAFLYLPLKEKAGKRLAGPLCTRPQFVLSQADTALKSRSRLWHKRKAQVL